MEKETFDFIGGILVIIMVIFGIGIGFYWLHVIISSTKKKEKDVSRLICSANVKFTPCNNPFEKLWKESGASAYFDMDGANHGRLTINSIREDNELSLMCDNEEVYRDAILKLMKCGMVYKRMNANNPELRKFCIINTSDCNTMENRIKNANILYDYINNGCQVKNKEG